MNILTNKPHDVLTNHATPNAAIDADMQSELNRIVSDTFNLLRVTGAGIVLYDEHKLSMAAVSSDWLASLDPTHFYTFQTIMFDRETEMMLPYGVLEKHKQQSVEGMIYYYFGIPLRRKNGRCIGCLFLINDKRCALAEMDKKIVRQQAIQLQYFLELQHEHSTYTTQAENFQFMLDALEDKVFIKNFDGTVIYANRAFLQALPEPVGDLVIQHPFIAELFATLDTGVRSLLQRVTMDTRNLFAKEQHEFIDKLPDTLGNPQFIKTTFLRTLFAGQQVLLGIIRVHCVAAS
jgi:PAS domain-containing protein